MGAGDGFILMSDSSPCQAVHHSVDPLYPHELLRASVLVALSSDAVTDDGAELSSAGDDGEGEEEAMDEDLMDVDVQDEGEILGEVSM